jgi:hypothetical protein
MPEAVARLSVCLVKLPSMKAYQSRKTTEFLDTGDSLAPRSGRFSFKQRAPGINWQGTWVDSRKSPSVLDGKQFAAAAAGSL